MIHRPPCISPLSNGLIGPTNGRAQILSSDKVGGGNGGVESDRLVDRAIERVRSTAESTREEDQVRQPRSPVTPGRPTKREIEEHCVDRGVHRRAVVLCVVPGWWSFGNVEGGGFLFFIQNGLCAAETTNS